MKITHVKSKVVLSEENYWSNFKWNFKSYGQDPAPFGIATCSRCKKTGVVRTTITNWGTHVIASPYCPACGAFMKNGCN